MNFMIFAVQFTQWLPIINKKLKINELKIAVCWRWQ